MFSEDLNHIKKIRLFKETIKVYIVFVLVIFIFLKIVRYYKQQLYIAKCLETLPGPKTIPFFGNGHIFWRANTHDIYKKFMDMIETFGRQSAFKFWIGHKSFVIITKPDDLRALYNSKYTLEKDRSMYRFFTEWLGADSLLIADVNVWKIHRRILAMTFTQRILDKYVNIFARNGLKLSEELKHYASDGSQTFDIYNVINKYTVNSICESLMGVEIEDETLIQQYLAAIQKEAKIIYFKMCKFWLHFDFIYKYFNMASVEKESMQNLRKFTEKVFEEKSRNYLPSAIKNNKRLKLNPKRKPFLEHLLDLDCHTTFYNEQQILDDINIFLAAGSETTAITSSFAFLLLAIHDDIQQKVFEEIQSILDDESGPITADHIRQMTYLEMVIKETLRLYPIVPIVARKTSENLILPASGVQIPAGTCCIAAPLAVHSDPNVWRDPEKFDPQRFAIEEKAKRHVYSFIPFSGGLRNCIGKKFAFMSLKVLIASVVRDYQIFTSVRLLDEIKLKIEVTLKATQGYPIRLVRRRKSSQ